MLTTLPPSCAVVTLSGNLNFLEPSGPLRACNGTALPLPSTEYNIHSLTQNAAHIYDTVSVFAVTERHFIVNS